MRKTLFSFKRKTSKKSAGLFPEKENHPSRILNYSVVLFLALSPALAGANGTSRYQGQINAGQEKTITGRVVDKNGQPLPGVSVLVKGTKQGTSTNAEGYFSIKVANDNATLIFQSVGKKAKEVKAGNGANLTIVLDDENASLDTVITVAFGTQNKRTMTSSVSQVNTKVIQDRPVNNLASALQGQVPGLNIVSSSGQPGANPSINIRGIGSIMSGTSPLIIVDGIPSSIAQVNPNDVESVSVLKDASASALYGARAANGVILIVTKKGKLGKPSVSYSGYVGWQKPTELFQEADAYSYANAYNTALMHDAISRAKPDFDPTKKVWTDEQLAGFKSGALPSTDWRDALFTGNNGFTQSHNVGISGGLSNGDVSVRNNLMLGYLQQNGNVANTSFKRFTLRDNGSIKWKRFSIDMNLGITYSNSLAPVSAAVGDLGAITSAINRQRPMDPIKTADGEWNITATNDTRNPIRQALEGGQSNTKNYNILANIVMAYDITKDISVKFTNGVNYLTSNQDMFKNTLDWYNGETTGPNSSTKTDYTDIHYLQQLDVTYKKTFGDHHIGVIIGGQQEFHTYRSLMGYRQDFILNTSGSLQLGAADGMDNSSTYYDWGLMGAFGRISYDYKRKYLLELNAREDGSSRLSPDHNWDFFPSVSAGWRISEENFMESLKPTVSELKLRGSYGVLGNQNIPGATNSALYYPYQATIGAANDPSYAGPLYYVFGDQLITPMTLKQNPNNTFTWERTSILDVALEGTLYKSLHFSLGYFDKTTQNMLMTVTPSRVNGGDPYVANIGKMRNSGLEVELGYNKATRSGLDIQLNGNFSYITNKLLDLGGQNLTVTGVTKNTVGYALNSYYLYTNNGLLTKDDFLNPSVTLLGGQKYGDQKILDYDKSGKIDAGDKTMQKKSNTPKWMYGFNFDVAYKNFGVAGMLQGAAGNFMYLGGSTGYGFSSGYGITNWTIKNSYDPINNPDNYNTRLPRVSASNTINASYPSTIFLFNASYVRLKNLRVYYNVPGAWSRKIGVGSLRAYVSGQNLYTLSKLPKDLGIDPEISSATAGYPLVKIWTFGVDVNF
ncbi:SusC/RagA family TonB-linked outer membrane protein [Pinibacter aurantiacus]|uniref:TonB-dependent receptor n=1 Tax=Pinibacter aurantiacus TaxID=2851599 RepID=A0A9E2S6R3_9BACT|nr:TonB-dependent receptor [Pinibacter aurantiacus]MBV4355739.1 TonB-dependent receptor [Pinibacter aurantiacus]